MFVSLYMSAKIAQLRTKTCSRGFQKGATSCWGSTKVTSDIFLFGSKVASSIFCHKASYLKPITFCLFGVTIIKRHLQYRAPTVNIFFILSLIVFIWSFHVYKINIEERTSNTDSCHIRLELVLFRLTVFLAIIQLS